MGKRPRSDVPYSLRLREKKVQEIGSHREDAAMTALEIMMIVLADDFGWGLERLARLGRKTGQAIREFWSAEDHEIERAHLRRRLEQIGFVFDKWGKLAVYVNPETEKPEKLKKEEEKHEAQTKRAP